MKINDELIRTLLFRRRITQKRLAELAGISRASVSSVCNGKSCALETAAAIADALGVTLDSIILKNKE